MDKRTRLSLRIVSWKRIFIISEFLITSMINIFAAFPGQLFSNRIIFFKLLRRWIIEYAVASTENAAYIIGGYHSYNIIDIIAKFQDNQWTRYGSLKATRRLHGSITSGDRTMIIGGDSYA